MQFKMRWEKQAEVKVEVRAPAIYELDTEKVSPDDILFDTLTYTWNLHAIPIH